jgi:hypothetical protein
MARAAKHVPGHDGESRSRTGQAEEFPARHTGRFGGLNVVHDDNN